METTRSSLIKPLTHGGHTLSLRSAGQKFGMQQTHCVKYVEQLDAVAVGEFNNPNEESRNAAAALVSLGSDRQRKRAKWPTRHSGRIR